MTYSGSWEHEMFPAYVRPGFSHLPSQDLDSSLTHMFWSVPRWRCEGNFLKISNVFSFLYATLSSLIIYLANSIHLGLLKLSTLSQLRECWTLSSPSLNCGRKFSSWSWGNYRAHLICFPSPKDHSLVLPVFQHLKSIVSNILSKLLDILCWRKVKVYEEILWDYVNILFSNIFLFNGFSIHWLFLFISSIAMMVENSDFLTIISSTFF